MRFTVGDASFVDQVTERVVRDRKPLYVLHSPISGRMAFGRKDTDTVRLLIAKGWRHAYTVRPRTLP